MWGTADPLGMHGLPRVGAGAALEGLRLVLKACYYRFTFTFQQNWPVIPNVRGERPSGRVVMNPTVFVLFVCVFSHFVSALLGIRNSKRVRWLVLSGHGTVV
jgi:hypothetical protein